MTQFWFLSLHYNGDNSYLFVNRQEISKFIATNGNENFLTQFSFGSICDGFSAIESTEVSLNRKMYDFQSITILLINVTY